MPRKKKEETRNKAPRAPEKKKETKMKATMKATPKKASPSSGGRIRKTAKAAQPPIEALSGTLPDTSSRTSSPQKKAPVQTQVSAGKFPRNQETQVITFARDPRSIYAYWEVAPGSVEEAKNKLREEFKSSALVLRMFRTNGQVPAELLYEIEPGPGSVSRYLEVDGEGQSYFVEVGQKTGSGKYVPYARSRTLTMGSNKPSPIVDPQWTPSPGMEKYYEEEVPTHSVPGPSSAQAPQVRKAKWSSPTSSSQH